jgi:hypothetical protein
MKSDRNDALCCCQRMIAKVSQMQKAIHCNDFMFFVYQFPNANMHDGVAFY